jgi:hypothetical protein
MPESDLAGAKELVDAFIAHDGSGTGGRKRPPKDADWPLGILMLGVGKSQKKKRTVGSRPRPTSEVEMR